MADEWRFIEVRHEDKDILVIRFRITDFCDTVEVRACGEEILKAYEESRPRDLIVDFQGMEVVPSTVFASLVLVYKRMCRQGGRLRLCSMGRDALGAFYVLNLYRLMTVHGNLGEALAAARATEEVPRNPV